MQRRIEAHFAGRIRPAEERVLRQHLPECAPCRRYYDRQLAVASLDPERSARVRLARGLGLPLLADRADDTVRWQSWALAVAGVMTACALALGFLAPGAFPAHNDGFAPRGGIEPAAEVVAYVARAGKQPARLDQAAGQATIRATDEIAFAYRNPKGYRRLLVFARDELGNVYWYYPSWLEPAETPRAIAIEVSAELRELPEAVAHDLHGKGLQVYAIFTDEALSVRDIEDKLRGHQAPEALRLDGIVQPVATLRVQRETRGDAEP